MLISLAILVWVLLGFIGWFNMVLSEQEVTVTGITFLLPLYMIMGLAGIMISARMYGDEVIFSWKGKRR